ncbi:MAG TPA: hypothetical protein VE195_07025 [Acidobacteriaceae bacterium]|nr:hypothetical protein [Acidobacteriaceae bacterium]
MSFEIVSNSGQRRLLEPQDSFIHSTQSSVAAIFLDQDGHRYSAFFDGSYVIFNEGSADFIGRWLQGSAATVIMQTRGLPEGFQFTFMDHGPRPQRLHALWSFQGPMQQAISAWKQAGFSVSVPDRAWNRNHPVSAHLRNRGAALTGADSSHVTIPFTQTGRETRGEIHVGEFNPLTGLGLGFLLHQLERWL